MVVLNLCLLQKHLKVASIKKTTQINMKNATQLERYKKLLTYLDGKFKEEINTDKVEAISHYSYRNINRIFKALHHETIGKYIKRRRMEKAAEYLKYTDKGISEIAYEVGFEDRFAFSKAFKKTFNCSPNAFRNSCESKREIIRQSFDTEKETERQKLQFEVKFLANFEFLCLEYRGLYDDILAIKKAYKQLLDFALEKGTLTGNSIFMTEIKDDNEISDSLNFRYNLGIVLDKPLTFKPDGLFKSKVHKRQKHARFIHKGAYEKCIDTYNKIYAFWWVEVNLELADLPTIEIYLNNDEDTPKEELLTEIYIPVK